MAAKRKSAIEARQGHPEGIIDDITRWGWKQLHNRAISKTLKANKKFGKLAASQGGSVDISSGSKAAKKAVKLSNTMKKYGATGKTEIYRKKAGYK